MLPLSWLCVRERYLKINVLYNNVSTEEHVDDEEELYYTIIITIIIIIIRLKTVNQSLNAFSQCEVFLYVPTKEKFQFLFFFTSSFLSFFFSYIVPYLFISYVSKINRTIKHDSRFSFHWQLAFSFSFSFFFFLSPLLII